MSSLTKPKSIGPGSTIGLFSPAYFVDAEEYRQIKQALEKLGFKVYLHPQTEEKNFSMAGHPEIRLQAMHDLFKDPQIDAIMCGSGGYGALQFIDQIDYELIKQNPKVFIGYSDNTALLTAIRKKCNMVTFHGMNGLRLMTHNYCKLSVDSFMRICGGEAISYDFPDMKSNFKVLNPGEVKGPLEGCNHILLNNIANTDFAPIYEDCIFFTESNKPVFSDLDQNLFHFNHSGTTRNLKAFIFGETEGRNYHVETLSHIQQGFVFEDMIPHHYPDIPSAMNFPSGHAANIFTLPWGVECQLTLEGNNIGQLKMLEPATQ